MGTKLSQVSAKADSCCQLSASEPHSPVLLAILPSNTQTSLTSLWAVPQGSHQPHEPQCTPLHGHGLHKHGQQSMCASCWAGGSAEQSQVSRIAQGSFPGHCRVVWLRALCLIVLEAGRGPRRGCASPFCLQSRFCPGDVMQAALTVPLCVLTGLCTDRCKV